MVKEKLTLEELKMEIELKRSGASSIFDKEGEMFGFEMTDWDEYDYILHELRNPETAEATLACHNCQNQRMCDYCSYGGNQPPMGI